MARRPFGNGDSDKCLNELRLLFVQRKRYRLSVSTPTDIYEKVDLRSPGDTNTVPIKRLYFLSHNRVEVKFVPLIFELVLLQ